MKQIKGLTKRKKQQIKKKLEKIADEIMERRGSNKGLMTKNENAIKGTMLPYLIMFFESDYKDDMVTKEYCLRGYATDSVYINNMNLRTKTLYGYYGMDRLEQLYDVTPYAEFRSLMDEAMINRLLKSDFKRYQDVMPDEKTLIEGVVSCRKIMTVFSKTLIHKAYNDVMMDRIHEWYPALTASHLLEYARIRKAGFDFTGKSPEDLMEFWNENEVFNKQSKGLLWATRLMSEFGYIGFDEAASIRAEAKNKTMPYFDHTGKGFKTITACLEANNVPYTLGKKAMSRYLSKSAKKVALEELTKIYAESADKEEAFTRICDKYGIVREEKACDVYKIDSKWYDRHGNSFKTMTAAQKSSIKLSAGKKPVPKSYEELKNWRGPILAPDGYQYRSLGALCEAYGKARSGVLYRVSRGMSLKDALEKERIAA